LMLFSDSCRAWEMVVREIAWRERERGSAASYARSVSAMAFLPMFIYAYYAATHARDIGRCRHSFINPYAPMLMLALFCAVVLPGVSILSARDREIKCHERLYAGAERAEAACRARYYRCCRHMHDRAPFCQNERCRLDIREIAFEASHSACRRMREEAEKI